MKKFAKYLLLLALAPAFSDVYNIYPQQQPYVSVQYPLANYPPEYRQVLYIGTSGNTIKLDDESNWVVESSTANAYKLTQGDLVRIVPGNYYKPGNFLLECNEKNITIRVQEDVPPNKLNPGNYNFSSLQGYQIVLTNTLGRQFIFQSSHVPTSWQLNDSIIVARQRKPCCGNYWNYYVYSFEASEGVQANLVN